MTVFNDVHFKSSARPLVVHFGRCRLVRSRISFLPEFSSEIEEEALNFQPQVKLQGMYVLFSVKCLYFYVQMCFCILLEIDKPRVARSEVEFDFVVCPAMKRQV